MDTSHLFGEWSEVYCNGITEKRHHGFSVPRWYNHLCTEVGRKSNTKRVPLSMTLNLKFVKCFFPVLIRSMQSWYIAKPLMQDTLYTVIITIFHIYTLNVTCVTQVYLMGQTKELSQCTYINLYILHNKILQYKIVFIYFRLKTTVACLIKLHKFPFDEYHCSLMIETCK